MANVSHASLTGSELHEPKGVASAPLGTVYVANGAGSGTWSSIGTSAFTGMVADFLAPTPPTGWLELDGSVISTSTYAALYAVMSVTTSGTRTNGNAIVTSIPDTSSFRPGYYVFGTGIASGTTILSVDSASQITLSANASSSGSSSFAVSPFLLNTGTIKLPDLTTAGRYRRSRTSTLKVGDLLADQYPAHTHSLSVTGSTSTDGAHNHAINISDPGHAHAASVPRSTNNGFSGDNTQLYNGSVSSGVVPINVSSATTGITASSSGAGSHNHTVSATGTSGSAGTGTETRPTTLVVLTCIKT